MNKLIKQNVAYLFLLSMTIGQVTPFMEVLTNGEDNKYKEPDARVAQKAFDDILDSGLTNEILRDMISLPGLGPATLDLENNRQAERCL